MWRAGRGRRVPERTTNPLDVTPTPRWTRRSLAKTEQLPEQNHCCLKAQNFKSNREEKLQLQHTDSGTILSSSTADAERR